MSNVTKAIDVNVPVRTAYNQWTQFEEFPQFMSGVEQVRQLDDTRLQWRTKVGGQTEEFDAEITEQVPDQRIAWRSVTGKGNSGVVTFHHLNPTTTRVTLQLEYQPEGIVETVGDKLGFMERQIQSDLGRFKSYIETRGVESGAWRGEVDQSHGTSAYNT